MKTAAQSRLAQKPEDSPPVQSRIYERGARSQCREIANTINVDLISFRARSRANPPRYRRICERGTKENDGVGTRRKKRRRDRVLVTKEHVADVAARRGGGWSGGEFHNALVSSNPGRRMIALYRLSAEPSFHRPAISCLKEFRRIPRVTVECAPYVDEIRRRRRWISRRITSNNVASELKIDFSPKGERALGRLMSLTSAGCFYYRSGEYGSFDDGQYLLSYSG